MKKTKLIEIHKEKEFKDDLTTIKSNWVLEIELPISGIKNLEDFINTKLDKVESVYSLKCENGRKFPYMIYKFYFSTTGNSLCVNPPDEYSKKRGFDIADSKSALNAEIKATQILKDIKKLLDKTSEVISNNSLNKIEKRVKKSKNHINEFK